MAEKKAESKTEKDAEDERITTSSDARFATYEEVPAGDLTDENPPPGKHVYQHRGTPS